MNTQKLKRILIVDDEPLARARIKRLLPQQEGFTCIAEAENAKQAWQLAEQYKPDIVLLDIEMPDIDGISFACELDKLSMPPAVIFVTAHAEHALEAYNANPLDYILKPVSAERLLVALNRAQARVVPAALALEKLSYTMAGVTKQLFINDILYCIAEDKYVRVVTENTSALIDHSLNQLQQMLPQKFLRIHRKTLINSDYFCSLHVENESGTYIKLQGVDEPLDVSRRALPHVKQALQITS
ncbi:LytTR family DNA-binding domain-containing protein [Rheinheimera sp. MMS21-TC3]|uniref:LytR/AlgR family response regulator transcription factor n=1 Tax=Rheinheimera sp. MMS21-TC3 TaxID=3072790 RepID=UPI0028C3D0EB|nr:LytTR family DNA-binding domain-containing protein [Rheinheimera sp. MMS21-TC3]WNO59992.1 LytTR family DNA-binding domain-containing protein [Rheinheimera sp. MMS21-TC3]